jgi:hypothetical protein
MLRQKGHGSASLLTLSQDNRSGDPVRGESEARALATESAGPSKLANAFRNTESPNDPRQRPPSRWLT